MFELCLDVCAACGSSDFRPSKLNGFVEKLASPFLIPYRCRSCACRQFKLAKLRVSSTKRVVLNDATAKVLPESPDVPPAVLPTAPLSPLLPDPAARKKSNKSAHLVAWHKQALAFLHRLSIAAIFRRIRSALTRVRRPAICALIGVAGFELILQVAALAMWYSDRPRPQHLVLCIGDSYTFGTGATASEFSYPSILGKLLRRTDESWQVVNAGWPDHDSRDAVLTLPDYLLHYRPAKVYIVVGARDFLTRPNPAPGSITKSVSYSFPMVWRTALAFRDFAKWVKVASAKVSVPASDWLRVQISRGHRLFGPSPIGAWLYQGQVIRIRDDGLVTFGDVKFRWETHGDQLDLIPANGVAGPPAHYQWERRGQGLFIKGGIFPEGLLLEPLEDGEARLLEAEAARSAQHRSVNAPPSSASAFDLDKQTEREEKLRLALNNAQPAARFFLRSNLSRLCARIGKCGQATAELAQMRSEMDAAGDPEPMVETYIDTAEFIDEGALALAAARTFAPRYASNAAIEKAIAWESYRNRDFGSAVAAIDKALSLAGRSSARAAILNMRARIFLDNNPPKSLESLIEAYETNGDEFALRSQLDPGLGVYNQELLNLSLDNLNASFDVRQAVRNAVNELKHASGDIETVLARNLRLMADMVRATGAEAVFVSYPLAESDRVNKVIRQVASEKNAGLIDIEPTFSQHLQITHTKVLFEPDGHLTNQGYALVADLVAADVSRRKQ